MAISNTTVVAFRSDRTGRRYFSLRAACAAEARAIIAAKYPVEHPEYESGHMIYPGSSWHDLPRSEVLYRRMTRLIQSAYKRAAQQPKGEREE